MAAINDKRQSILSSLDWFTIIVYMALLAMGWMSVCGASYDFDQGGNFFDFSTRSGMQIVWISTSILLGGIILTIDERVYDTFAYVLYLAFMILLLVTPLLAHDIKGSLSWIKIGSFSIQPAEFAKFLHMYSQVHRPLWLLHAKMEGLCGVIPYYIITYGPHRDAEGDR